MCALVPSATTAPSREGDATKLGPALGVFDSEEVPRVLIASAKNDRAREASSEVGPLSSAILVHAHESLLLQARIRDRRVGPHWKWKKTG